MISAALTLGGRRGRRLARAARPLFLFLAGCLAGALTLIVIDAWLRPPSSRSACQPDILSAKRLTLPQLSTPRPNAGLILVGVMTAARYVDTRARAVWRTWAHAAPGRAFFFVAANTTVRVDHSDGYGPLPIVRLPGVDDVYPPQKKSFAMLRWMYDNYLEDFEWFMRADDDLYVRNERLTAFLRQLDAGRAHMLGQAGLGNSAEYGQLALGARDNYCMGGPGVILSREALRQLGPHLETCLGELATSHEDVEVGRCVRRYVGITCTWNYEMQTLFHNNQTGGRSADAPVTGELRRVLTLHPVKNADLMLKVHMHAEALRLAELRARHVALARERDAAAGNGATATLKLTRRAANDASDLTHWDYMSLNKLMFCADRVNCPRHTINANQRAAVSEVVTQLFDKFNANARQRGRLLQFQNVQYGYVRVEPRYGVDYVLDIVLWFKKLRPARTISVRRHAYVQQTFGALEALTDAEHRALHSPLAAANAPPIYIIIALRGRAETFQRFARRLRDILRPDERDVKIIVVLYRENDEENVLIAETIGDLSQSLHVRVVDMAAPPTADDDATFSRGRALKIGASTAPSDALLFFADVDMLFDYGTLQRIRLNTIEGVQVYFPIIFSQYMKKYWLPSSFIDSKSIDESDDIEEYAPDRGYFRSFGFGIVAIHARDFVRVGGFNVTIRGWGMEDVDFFERCIRARLHVLRAPDPSLVHVAHPIECRRDAMPHAQYQMCVGTKAASMASRDFLADRLASHFGGVIP